LVVTLDNLAAAAEAAVAGARISPAMLKFYADFASKTNRR
jgi:hypothetical protein